MRVNLRLFTGLCLGMGFAVLVLWPYLLVHRPRPGASREVRRTYVIQLIAVAGAGLISVVGASLGSILLVRRAREEFAIASRQNVEKLVEGIRKGVSPASEDGQPDT